MEKEKETPKQLFGPSPSATPNSQHKSERNIKQPVIFTP